MNFLCNLCLPNNDLICKKCSQLISGDNGNICDSCLLSDIKNCSCNKLETCRYYDNIGICDKLICNNCDLKCDECIRICCINHSFYCCNVKICYNCVKFHKCSNQKK